MGKKLALFMGMGNRNRNRKRKRKRKGRVLAFLGAAEYRYI